MSYANKNKGVRQTYTLNGVIVYEGRVEQQEDGGIVFLDPHSMNKKDMDYLKSCLRCSPSYWMEVKGE